MLNDDLSEIKQSVIEESVALGHPIPVDYYDKYQRLLNYAYKYDQSLLNEDCTDLNSDTLLKYILLDESIPTSTSDKIRRSCHR